MTWKMPTLGERMRANIERLDREHLSKAARERADLMEHERQRKEKIRKHIETLKRTITQAILDGLIVKPVKLPNEWYGYARPISDAQHIDNHIWQEFEQWAAQEGLVVKCRYEHDGFGMVAWYMLEVFPA